MNVFLICETDKIQDYEMPQQQRANISENNDMFQVEEKNLLQLSIKKNKMIGEYEEYDCSIDLKKKQSGFLENGTDFEYFYQSKTFKGYKKNTIICLNVKTDTGVKFCKELSKRKNSNCIITPISIDFEALQKKVENITGVTVKTNDDANISAKSLYGNKIDSSTEYSSTVKRGTMSQLTFEFTREGDSILVLVSKKGSVFFINYPDTNNLTFLLDKTFTIYSELLA